jgi:hypothetical protein
MNFIKLQYNENNGKIRFRDRKITVLNIVTLFTSEVMKP